MDRLRGLASAGIANYISSLSVRFPNLSLLVTSISEPLSVRHIPSRVPYLSYEPLAEKGRKMSERIRNEPIDFVKNALVGGDHTSNTHVD